MNDDRYPSDYADLQAELAQQRDIINATDDILFKLDTQQRHTAIYGCWVEENGVSPEMFLGRTARDIFGDAADVHERANAQALAGECVTYEWTIPNHEGVCYYSTLLTPTYADGDGDTVTGILGVGHDITEYRRMEILLRIQRNLIIKLSTSQNFLESLQYLLDSALGLDGIDAGGVYQFTATGDLTLLSHQGLPPDFVATSTHYAANSPQVQMIQAGEPIYSHYAHIAPSPEKLDQSEGLRALVILPICIQQGANPPQLIGVLNLASRTYDEIPHYIRKALETIVTQTVGVLARLRAEAQVHESEARYKSLVEGSPDIVYAYSTTEGGLYASARVTEILGYQQFQL